MSRRFARTREDFHCTQCGEFVAGNGYTNHCPACLWSRHVDVRPGDRQATCRAPMRPRQVLDERGEFVIVHECVACGSLRRNRAAPEDDLSSLL